MGGANGSRECAPDDKLRDAHRVLDDAMGFAKRSPHPTHDLLPDGLFDLPDGQISELAVTCLSSPPCKNILIFRIPKSVLYVRRPVPLEGRFAIVTDVGRGMRWTWKCP